MMQHENIRGLALLILISFPALPVTSLDQILDKMDNAAKAFDAMSADIRKTLHTAVINTDDVEEGKVLLKRTKKGLRMLTELTQPDEKAAALDGGKLELFYPKLNKVEEYNIGKNRGMVEQFFLLGFGTPREELERDYSAKLLGEDKVGSQTAVRLEFTPKSPELLKHIKKAEIWVSPSTGYPVQQKFYLSGGDYHLVTYSHLKINPPISDNALKLKLPKGVERTKK